jgi:hypothetical protein
MGLSMAKGDDVDEWFEVSDRDWIPQFKAKRLKLLADAQVPEQIVTEIENAGIAIRAMSPRSKQSSDHTVLQLAQREGRVLLTLDADFWDDRKHPLEAIRRGVIFVGEPPGEYDRILRAFGLVYGCFAKSYPLDWWHGMKIRAVLGEFEIKMRTWQGKVAKYRMKLRGGYIVAKEG